MTQFIWTVIGLAGLVIPAWATPIDDCAGRLEIPGAYAHHFARYSQKIYAVPLSHGSHRVNGIYRELEIHDQPPAEIAPDPLTIGVSAEVETEDSNSPRWFRFRRLSVGDQLAPGYAYRLVLAHLLSRMPDVRRIDFDLYALPDYGRVRGFLMQGAAVDDAFAESEAVSVLIEFGFTRIEPRVSFDEGSEPRELILSFRAARPPQRDSHSASSNTP